jgi:hypothetical protein
MRALDPEVKDALWAAFEPRIRVPVDNQLILMLPPALVKVARNTAGWEYREAIEVELDQGFSSTPQTARRNRGAILVEAIGEDLGVQQAAAAALCVVDSFIDHARGRDGCDPQREARKRASAALDESAVHESVVTDLLVRAPR